MYLKASKFQISRLLPTRAISIVMSLLLAITGIFSLMSVNAYAEDLSYTFNIDMSVSDVSEDVSDNYTFNNVNTGDTVKIYYAGNVRSAASFTIDRVSKGSS